MVAAQYAYSKGRTFMRRISAAFAVLFGLFALFFTAPPKLWGGATNQNMLGNFFTQNTAHADTPHSCSTVDGCADAGAGACTGTGGTSSSGVGPGGVDSVGDSVGGGVADSSGGCGDSCTGVA